MNEDLREGLTVEDINELLRNIEVLKLSLDMNDINDGDRKDICHFLTQYQIVLRKSKVVVQ